MKRAPKAARSSSAGAEPPAHDDSSVHERPPRERASAARPASRHHSVYVVYLRNPKGDGKAGYYVGMTGLSPEQRFENHKRGHKDAGVVRRFGERLVPKLYEHLNPMTYADALAMEARLADELRAKGYQVFGGH